MISMSPILTRRVSNPGDIFGQDFEESQRCIKAAKELRSLEVWPNKLTDQMRALAEQCPIQGLPPTKGAFWLWFWWVWKAFGQWLCGFRPASWSWRGGQRYAWPIWNKEIWWTAIVLGSILGGYYPLYLFFVNKRIITDSLSHTHSYVLFQAELIHVELAWVHQIQVKHVADGSGRS